MNETPQLQQLLAKLLAELIANKKTVIEITVEIRKAPEPGWHTYSYGTHTGHSEGRGKGESWGETHS